MPTNLYGPGDNFHPENSHVIPALLRRFHEAKAANANSVTIWGTGRARREFLHVDDMAAACLQVMAVDPQTYGRATEPMCSHVNVGTGTDCTIGELAETIAGITGFEGEIAYDKSKPDGAPRKLLDISRLEALGWRPGVTLHAGLEDTYRWYCAQSATRS
jgi:GDP-L-fucose synthase